MVPEKNVVIPWTAKKTNEMVSKEVETNRLLVKK